MTDLHKAGLLENCLWSYTTHITLDEPETDNPIEVDTLDIRTDIVEFLNAGPYTCDTLTADQQNDHHGGSSPEHPRRQRQAGRRDAQGH